MRFQSSDVLQSWWAIAQINGDVVLDFRQTLNVIDVSVVWAQELNHCII